MEAILHRHCRALIAAAVALWTGPAAAGHRPTAQAAARAVPDRQPRESLQRRQRRAEGHGHHQPRRSTLRDRGGTEHNVYGGSTAGLTALVLRTRVWGDGAITRPTPIRLSPPVAVPYYRRLFLRGSRWRCRWSRRWGGGGIGQHRGATSAPTTQALPLVAQTPPQRPAPPTAGVATGCRASHLPRGTYSSGVNYATRCRRGHDD
jgi:hypothetical protein